MSPSIDNCKLKIPQPYVIFFTLFILDSRIKIAHNETQFTNSL